MKVAIINYTWSDGSTGKITVNMYNRIKAAGHEVRVYYGVEPSSGEHKKCFYYFGNKVIFLIDHVVSNLTGLSGALAFGPTKKLMRMLDEYQPDIILLYNLHGGYVNEYRLLEYAKKKAKWTIYGMVDEYPFLGKCCYSFDCEKYKYERGCHHCPRLRESPRSLLFDNSHFHFKKKEKVYKDFNNISFTSAPYVVDKAKGSWLLRDKEFFTSDTHIDVKNVYYPREAESMRKKLGIAENKKVVIIAASINTPYKGVKYFLEAAKKCENDNIVFINVGYDGDISICPSNYIPLPYIRDQDELCELLSLADAYVCTSIEDAQPNACLKALGCGTPIIGFNVSGVPYIAPAGLGSYATPFDVDELCEIIRNHPRKTPDIINACHNYALSRYDISLPSKHAFYTIADRVEAMMQKSEE